MVPPTSADPGALSDDSIRDGSEIDAFGCAHTVSNHNGSGANLGFGAPKVFLRVSFLNCFKMSTTDLHTVPNVDNTILNSKPLTSRGKDKTQAKTLTLNNLFHAAPTAPATDHHLPVNAPSLLS